MTETERQNALLLEIRNNYYLKNRFEKSEFLEKLWETLSSIVKLNKGNKLISKARMKNMDLIPRHYAIISLCYASYSNVESLSFLPSDFVGLLTKDLDAELQEALSYADSIINRRSFFPELITTWRAIDKIYKENGHRRDNYLPPTPYFAYSLLTLNRPELIGGKQGSIHLALLELQEKQEDMMRAIHS